MSLIRSFLTYHHVSCQQSKYNTPNEKHSPNEFHNPICINIKERFIMHAKMRCIITQLDTFFPCWEKLFPQYNKVRGTEIFGPDNENMNSSTLIGGTAAINKHRMMILSPFWRQHTNAHSLKMAKLLKKFIVTKTMSRSPSRQHPQDRRGKTIARHFRLNSTSHQHTTVNLHLSVELNALSGRLFWSVWGSPFHHYK